MQKVKKILLTGGGTGGSATPLLAVVDEIRDAIFIWLGTKSGPEQEMTARMKIEFKAIASGKWRRYLSWQNFTDLFLIIIGFFQSLFIIKKYQPDLVMSAGSFVSVPAVWAAWILRVPVLIHQQDARPGLANKLMAPFARVITVTFEKSLDNYNKKAIWIGNPVRSQITNIKISKQEARQKLGLSGEKQVVLIMGGGTGAQAINNLTKHSLDALTKFCQIIHITGKGKDIMYGAEFIASNIKNYHPFEFLDTMAMAKVFAAADIVVSRCGMGVLTEVSYLGKPTILIPMPNSHQEDNAEIFQNAEAAIVLEQKNLTPNKFVKHIKELINNKELRNKLRNNIKTVMKPGANEKMVEIINDILTKI